MIVLAYAGEMEARQLGHITILKEDVNEHISN